MTATYFQWSQPIIPHSLPSSSSSSSTCSQSLASGIFSSSSSLSKRRRCRSEISTIQFCRYHFNMRLDSSCLFSTAASSTTSLRRAHSFDHLLQLETKLRASSIRRSRSASLDAAFLNEDDEEFWKKIRELALKFQVLDDSSDTEKDSYGRICKASPGGLLQNEKDRFVIDSMEPPWPGDVHATSIERKANSIDIPLSLRIIKRKMQWEEGFREVGESAYCSVKKAFSSMVFIIRELHCYSLQMRELLSTQDLQGVLVRVQKEMHASFVWLFQQVFSHTPTLMVYVMILLANFTVYSMASNAAIMPPATGSVSSVAEVQDQQQNHHRKFDSTSVKTFSLSSSGGKSTSIGGNNGGGGGGGKIRPFTSGTDGDGWLNGSDKFRPVVPDRASQLSSFGTTGEAEPSVSVSGEEESLWISVVDEASQMEASLRDQSLDHETIRRFVSPIKAELEPDDYADYFRTELLYQTVLSQDPNNPLLLANFAQFLYLVARDYDRAEEYFKRALKVGEGRDAEACSKYASFLWRVRGDLWAAEETFLEAIAADPTNSYYAANYAHFLWNTGGEDTCFPIITASPDSS